MTFWTNEPAGHDHSSHDDELEEAKECLEAHGGFPFPSLALLAGYMLTLLADKAIQRKLATQKDLTLQKVLAEDEEKQ